MLVVEDERWVRESLRFMLGESVAACCATAHEALRELADGTPIDVALVDLGLPDMRGAELIRRIHQARPGVATVVFTVCLLYTSPSPRDS